MLKKETFEIPLKYTNFWKKSKEFISKSEIFSGRGKYLEINSI